MGPIEWIRTARGVDTIEELGDTRNTKSAVVQGTLAERNQDQRLHLGSTERKGTEEAELRRATFDRSDEPGLGKDSIRSTRRRYSARGLSEGPFVRGLVNAKDFPGTRAKKSKSRGNCQFLCEKPLYTRAPPHPGCLSRNATKKFRPREIISANVTPSSRLLPALSQISRRQAGSRLVDNAPPKVPLNPHPRQLTETPR